MGEGEDSSSANRTPHLRPPSNDGRDLRTRIDDLRTRLFPFVSRPSQTASATEGTEHRDPEPPSSKARPRLLGTVNWSTATVIGIFAGMFYGGSKEAAASVSKDAEVTLKLGSTPDKREQYRLMRDAMEKRLIRVTRGSIIGGVRLGMFTAAFFGLQNLFAEKRGVHDVYNIAGAGSATAAFFGLILPGSLRWRLRNVLLGSTLGAAFCFPAGWVHLKLVEKANEGNPALDSSDDRDKTSGGVAAAIQRLESSLTK